jgi:YbbR domain-containing protein
MIKFIRNLLANFATFLLSLILAVIIWISASQADNPVIRTSLQIPIVFIGQPSDTKLVAPTDLNATVSLTIQGQKSIIEQASEEDFLATVDLSRVELGTVVTAVIDVQQSNSRVEVEFQSPETMQLRLEQLISADIPIEVEIRNDLARGYSHGQPTTEPQFITVTGTQSEVESISVANILVSLDNDDRETKIVSQLPIFYDKQGQVVSSRNLRLSSPDVEVSIPISESDGFAEKFIAVNIEGEPSPGYRILSISVEPTSVVVQGRQTQLNLLQQLKTEPIDITGLTESFITQATLTLPNGIELDEITEIVVTVEIEPFESAQTYSRTLEIIGIGEGLVAVLEPKTVRIVLFGPSPVLNELSEEEVIVTVDLFGLKPGVYTGLEPNISIPERGLEVRSIVPTLVTASITKTITPTNELTTTIAITNALSLQNDSTAKFINTQRDKQSSGKNLIIPYTIGKIAVNSPAVFASFAQIYKASFVPA